MKYDGPNYTSTKAWVGGIKEVMQGFWCLAHLSALPVNYWNYVVALGKGVGHHSMCHSEQRC